MPKRLRLTAAACAAACAAAGYLSWRSAPAEGRSPLAGLAENAVSRVEISRAGAPLILEKKAGRWRLSAPLSDAADAAACSELLSALRELTLGSQVSDDPASYPAYELSESGAARVRLYAEASAAPVLDGYFGKPAFGTATLYFRLAREKPVYLASGVEGALLRREAVDYRERLLFAPDLGPLSGFKIASGGKTRTIEKTDPLFRVISSLRAADFTADGPAEGRGLAIEALGSNRPVRWIISGKTENPAYRAARSAERAGAVTVASYDVDMILKALKRP